MRDVRMRGFRERTSVEDALAVLEAHGPRRPPSRSRSPRRPAASPQPISSPSSRVPHFARAAMDGYAVVGESTFGATSYAPVELVLLGDARPGRPFEGAVRAGEAVPDHHRGADARTAPTR